MTPLPNANALYGLSGRWAFLPGKMNELAWRLEYRSRRYHEIWARKRNHRHIGSWDACPTVACSEDRDFLRHLADVPA